MDRQQLLRRLARSPHNVHFADFVDLIEGFGFELIRVRGTHHLFAHPPVPRLVNLQDMGGEAKPYQIRQFLKVVERYNLKLEAE
jgi:predicted RNA binding protein YcfA (HicA-like mRNA interferase family)